MADRTSRRRLWVGLGLLVAGAAWASPWDTDMINGVNFKAYEWNMLPSPADTVQRGSLSAPQARANGYAQGDYVAAVDRNSPAIDTLNNPFAADEQALPTGKRSFQVTCAPCHGIDGKGGGPVTQNDPTKGIRRFPVPAPALSGAGAVSAQRSDGYIYATIRNGGALMPGYGVSLTEAERWYIVAYIRTLEGAQYTAPAAPTQPTGGTEG